nr:DUF1905 domain-containing protein [Acholeplasma laidlawii]
MKKLLDHQKLTLIYQPGFGSWTYHLVIPETASIKGTWGSLRVIGKIDDYVLHEHNLAPRKDEDKIISINKKIRSTINKSGEIWLQSRSICLNGLTRMRKSVKYLRPS